MKTASAFLSVKTVLPKYVDDLLENADNVACLKAARIDALKYPNDCATMERLALEEPKLFEMSEIPPLWKKGNDGVWTCFIG